MSYIILQILTFQLLFLLIYDLFLKKETFFQYNRIYLLITSCLGIVLPFIKFESLAHVIPTEYVISLPEIILGTTEKGTAKVSSKGFLASFSWQEQVFIIGIVVSVLWFFIKYRTLLSMRSKATIEKGPLYTKVIIKDSHAAFSFFKTIFVGDAISVREHDTIIQHELVHVRQRHSWDLMYFEILRAVFWCNPLLYIYQRRIAEIHEFIADAEVVGENKKAQYQLLLSSVFKTRDISFINPFFKQSLLKKRILMLQKSKSKNVKQLKYLFVIPVLLSMLLYASCEQESTTVQSDTKAISEKEVTIKVRDVNDLSEEEQGQISTLWATHQNETMDNSKALKIYLFDGRHTASVKMENGAISIEKPREEDKAIPFAVIDEVPIFPGCEGTADPRQCFQEKVIQHIRKNFRYPEAAKQQSIEGRVAIMFTIDKEGDIVNIKKRGPHELLEAEAERIIGLLPKMQQAGKHKGQVVSVPFSIPITFKLQ